MHQDLCMLQPAKDIIKFFKKIKVFGEGFPALNGV